MHYGPKSIHRLDKDKQMLQRLPFLVSLGEDVFCTDLGRKILGSTFSERKDKGGGRRSLSRRDQEREWNLECK